MSELACVMGTALRNLHFSECLMTCDWEPSDSAGRVLKDQGYTHVYGSALNVHKTPENCHEKAEHSAEFSILSLQTRCIVAKGKKASMG